MKSFLLCAMGLLFVTTLFLWWLHRWVLNLWSPEKKNYPERSYKGESFRGPLNSTISVVAIVLPIATTILAYTLPNGTSWTLSPLIVGIILMLATLLWGLYQAFSFATQCVGDDSFKITREVNWAIPADFAALLALFAASFIYLIVGIALIGWGENGKARSEKLELSAAHALIRRPRPVVRTAMKKVVELWGAPESRETLSKEKEIWTYLGPEIEHTFVFEKGELVSVKEGKLEAIRGN